MTTGGLLTGLLDDGKRSLERAECAPQMRNGAETRVEPAEIDLISALLLN
jgi:hypothetical protein